MKWFWEPLLAVAAVVVLLLVFSPRTRLALIHHLPRRPISRTNDLRPEIGIFVQGYREQGWTNEPTNFTPAQLAFAETGSWAQIVQLASSNWDINHITTWPLPRWIQPTNATYWSDATNFMATNFGLAILPVPHGRIAEEIRAGRLK